MIEWDGRWDGRAAEGRAGKCPALRTCRLSPSGSGCSRPFAHSPRPPTARATVRRPTRGPPTGCCREESGDKKFSWACPAEPGAGAPTDGRTGSTSLKDRSGNRLTLIVTPVGLHKYLFTVEYAPMATHTNASGTSTWYKYANEDLAYWNHDNRNYCWRSCGMSTSSV